MCLFSNASVECKVKRTSHQFKGFYKKMKLSPHHICYDQVSRTAAFLFITPRRHRNMWWFYSAVKDIYFYFWFWFLMFFFTWLCFKTTTFIFDNQVYSENPQRWCVFRKCAKETLSCAWLYFQAEPWSRWSKRPLTVTYKYLVSAECFTFVSSRFVSDRRTRPRPSLALQPLTTQFSWTLNFVTSSFLLSMASSSSWVSLPTSTCCLFCALSAKRRPWVKYASTWPT